jgi:hypothetical protein
MISSNSNNNVIRVVNHLLLVGTGIEVVPPNPGFYSRGFYPVVLVVAWAAVLNGTLGVRPRECFRRRPRCGQTTG